MSSQLTPEQAREIVQRFLLENGEAVKGTRRTDQTIIVEAKDWWQVEPVERWPHFQKSDLYELYEARLYIAADPPPAPHGFGVPYGDEPFHLNDAEQFRAFFAALGGALAPLELAGLLARYIGWSEVGRNQVVVIQREELEGVLGEHQVAAIRELIPLTVSHGRGARLVVEFCTYYLVSDEWDPSHRIGLNRWRAEAEDGRLAWRMEPLAAGLVSPRYG